MLAINAGAQQQEASLLVDVATLDGAAVRFPCAADNTVLELKRQVAARWVAPTAQLKLLAGHTVLRNEQQLSAVQALAPSGGDGAMLLQLLRELRHEAPQRVQVLSAAAPAGQWTQVAADIVRQLTEARVQQGQVLWIDLHSKGPRAAAVASAHFSRDLSGRGRLDIAYELAQQGSWEQLYGWAGGVAAGRDVISITGSSAAGGLTMAVFYHQGETSIAQEVEHVHCSASSWHGAAAGVLLILNELDLEVGQIVSIDAHNDGPDAPACFCAHFCRGLPGHGRLALDFQAMNVDAPWPAFHELGCDAAAGRDMVSVTSSSNCDGRSVLYAFSYFAGDLVEHLDVVAGAGSWRAAAQQLLQGLHDASLQRGQLLHIDAHNSGPGTPAVLSAYFNRALPGEGPLRVAFELGEGPAWRPLYGWAAELAAGKSVISITGASNGGRGAPTALSMLLFYLAGEASSMPAGPHVVEHVESAADSWEGAADGIVRRLAVLDLQRGQVVSIDAHNDSPDGPAMFSAHFCRTLPGRGPLFVRFRSLNDNGSWAAVHWQAAVMASAGEVLAITGSSNCCGRRVAYVFS